MVLIAALYEYYCNNCFYTYIVFQKINIIMFENWQDVNAIGLSASLVEYKKYLINIKNVTNILKMKHNKFKGCTKWAFVTLGTNILLETKTIIKT